MAVEFRLLGDVEARVDDQLIDLGPARRKCVLVVLLIEANRGVSVEKLVDRVWADRPPQRARDVLYSYLSRLRRTLAATNDVRIARQAGRYVLAVDPTAVDLHRFHRLTARARAADDDQAAAALLEEALALWRGSPFAEFDTPWLNTVREGLERQRRAAELDWNDLALRYGDHRRLVVDLSTRAASYPLDERLAGQLMLALYRNGRQGDALRLYQQTRGRLADELGADPSPPLRQLHQQILTTDPSLAAPTSVDTRSSPTSAASPVPHQLPVPLRAFTGRTDELARLDAVLTPLGERPTAVVISAVSGTAGIGKTALAVHWAHRTAERFPDGQLYVNLRGFEPAGAVLDPAEAVRGFLDALHVPPQRIPAGLDAQAALYRSQVANKRIVVLLDNARDAEQVRPLLPGAPGSLVVVTSRNQLTSLVVTDGAHPVTLDLLSVTEARDLLAGRLGADRVDAEPDAVDDIIASCARLPLALAIVAGRAAAHSHFPLHAFASGLRDTRDRLNALADSDPATDVRAVFSWSYRTLTPEAARLFRFLGLHPGPDVAAPAAASLARLPTAQVRPLLAELTRAHLLTEPTPGRYTFHDLLRAYATEQTHTTDSPTERHAAVLRMLDHYLHTAHTAALLLDPHRDPIMTAPATNGVTPEDLGNAEQATTWFTAEYSVLLNAIHQATNTGFDVYAWQLSWALSGFFNRQGRWRDRAIADEAALQSARRLANQPAQAYAHRGLARAHARLGRHDDALTHLQHALDLLDCLGDQTGQAHTHLGLSWVLDRQGHHAQALGHAVHALDLFRTVGNRFGQARALNMVGIVHALLGDRQQALIDCQQALSLHQQIGNRIGQAATWDSLGYINHQLGHHSQAVTSYQHALDLLRRLGDRYYEADTLIRLADTHLAASNPEAARHAWQRALVILDELDRTDADHVRAKLDRLITDAAAGSMTKDEGPDPT